MRVQQGGLGTTLAGAPAISPCAQSCGGHSLGPGRPGHGGGGIWGAGDSGDWPGVPGSRLDSRVPEHLMRTNEFCPHWVLLTTALGRSHGGSKPQGRLCSGAGGAPWAPGPRGFGAEPPSRTRRTCQSSGVFAPWRRTATRPAAGVWPRGPRGNAGHAVSVWPGRGGRRPALAIEVGR